MSKINKSSTMVTLPEHDLFATPRTQFSKEKRYVTVHRPLAPLPAASHIELQFTTEDNEYVDFSEMYFYVKLQVKLFNTDSKEVTADDWTKMIPENNLLHSLIKTSQLEINGKQLITSSDTYSYRSYIEKLLGYTKDAKASFLTASGWRSDSSELAKMLNPSKSKTKSVTLNLMDKLHLDLAYQGRELIGGCVVKLTLTPHQPQFFMTTSEDTLEVSVEIQEAELHVTRSRIARNLVDAHRKGLNLTTAKYPISRNEIKTFTLTTSIRSTIIDNVVYGQLPRRIFVFMVSNAAFNGNKNLSPFDFKHNNLKHIVPYVDGQMVCNQPFTPDFKNNQYVKEYMALFRALNQTGTDSTIPIPYDDFKKYPIFAFNLAQDGSNGVGLAEHLNEVRRGNLSLAMAFSEALTETINVIVFCEFDNVIEVDKDMVVFTDYM